jgi:hypothetical protein
VDIAADLAERLAGRKLAVIQRREHDWAFGFGDAPTSGLRVECPWRILFEGRIAFTDTDHAQRFGLPAPLDGEKEVERLLANKVVEKVTIRPDAGDLTIIFSGQTILEVLNNSRGYEGWEIRIGDVSVIALGGGELAIYRR